MTDLPRWFTNRKDAMLAIYDEDPGMRDASIKFVDSLADHLRYVIEAGRLIGVPEIRLMVHDESKFSIHEFRSYAKHFHGGGYPSGFARAWLHHMHYNPHHWQHWIFPDGFTPKSSNVENGVVQMPNSYALEMIADWMGASMAYTGSWDMNVWLIKNMPNIRLHTETAEYVRGKLDALGYADVVQRFAHEEQS